MTLFRKDNLNQGVQLTNWFLGALAFCNFVIGLVLVTSYHWREAYGNVVYESGAGLVFISLLQAPCSCLGVYGGRNHNKLILFIHTASMGFNCFVMLLLGGLVYEVTQTPWTKDFADDCLGAYPQDKTACFDDYLRTDKFQGFKLVWLAYYHFAVEEKVTSYKQDLINFQRDGSCCGFGPPLLCKDDRAPWPSNLPDDSTTAEWAYNGKRQLCSDTQADAPGWYKAIPRCNQIVDDTIYPPVYGGCPYEFPIGECSGDPPDESTRGCARHLEEVMQSSVSDTAAVVLIMTTIPLLAGICSCCLFLKRKDWDVLPETYPGIIKRKEAPVDAIDEDGFLLLSVAETPHEYIRAFNMCIRDAEESHRNKAERMWKLDDLIKVAHEKMDTESGWPAEVDAAYKRALRVVDQIESDQAQSALATAAND